MADNIYHHHNKSNLDSVLEKIPLMSANNQDKTDEVFAREHGHLRLADKPEFFKDLAWYWRLVKNWVFFLAALEILVYIISLFHGLKAIMLELVDPLLVVVDFVVFGFLTVKVKRQFKESWWQAFVANFLAGFAFGLIIAVFKAFWIREFWTIFNLITEPVFMGFIAVAVTLVVGIFVKRKRI